MGMVMGGRRGSRQSGIVMEVVILLGIYECTCWVLMVLSSHEGGRGGSNVVSRMLRGSRDRWGRWLTGR